VASAASFFRYFSASFFDQHFDQCFDHFGSIWGAILDHFGHLRPQKYAARIDPRGSREPTHRKDGPRPPKGPRKTPQGFQNDLQKLPKMAHKGRKMTPTGSQKDVSRGSKGDPMTTRTPQRLIPLILHSSRAIAGWWDSR
jgi:hypothetical protein